jgi:hypothetical protein
VLEFQWRKNKNSSMSLDKHGCALFKTIFTSKQVLGKYIFYEKIP